MYNQTTDSDFFTETVVIIIVCRNEPKSHSPHRINSEVFYMNACELTASITAVANALACMLSDDELSMLGVALTQLGDTLATIATQRSICKTDKCKTDSKASAQ